MAQLMPLPLTVFRFSKIQIGFTFLILGHQGSPRKRAIKHVCVSVFLKINDFSEMQEFIAFSALRLLVRRQEGHPA